MILFLSDGRPTDNEAEILNTISAENAKLGNQVVIQTFGIGQYASEYRQTNSTKWTFTAGSFQLVVNPPDMTMVTNLSLDFLVSLRVHEVREIVYETERFFSGQSTKDQLPILFMNSV